MHWEVKNILSRFLKIHFRDRFSMAYMEVLLHDIVELLELILGAKRSFQRKKPSHSKRSQFSQRPWVRRLSRKRNDKSSFFISVMGIVEMVHIGSFFDRQDTAASVEFFNLPKFAKQIITGQH